mmetsp:Transcript_42927/g.85013  ORF Transcript_42927/g.85013 Transcript_42927/m.85013 type:complete len:288 (+) Transcript_42927:680-1543(+)
MLVVAATVVVGMGVVAVVRVVVALGAPLVVMVAAVTEGAGAIFARGALQGFDGSNSGMSGSSGSSGCDGPSSVTSPVKQASVNVACLPHDLWYFLVCRLPKMVPSFHRVNLIFTIVNISPSILPMIQTLPPRSIFSCTGLSLMVEVSSGEYWDGSLSPPISRLVGDSSTLPVKQASLNVACFPHFLLYFLFWRFAMMEISFHFVNLILIRVRVSPSTIPMIQMFPPRSSLRVTGLPLRVAPLLGEYWDGSMSPVTSSLAGGFDGSSSGTSPVKQASMKVFCLPHASA